MRGVGEKKILFFLRNTLKIAIFGTS
jgi:hypothetical protein